MREGMAGGGADGRGYGWGGAAEGGYGFYLSNICCLDIFAIYLTVVDNSTSL